MMMMDGTLFPTRALVRAGIVSLAALGLSGCASISVPFGNLMGGDNSPVHTASIAPVASDAAEADSATQAPLPDALTAVAAVSPSADSRAQATERPADALVAAMPRRSAETGLSLTQSDLDAMSTALTHVLRSDDDAGTFSWSHEATGRSGLMTPFRQVSETAQGECRVVSVEITDGDSDKILLADACARGDRWEFVTPRAGEVL